MPHLTIATLALLVAGLGVVSSIARNGPRRANVNAGAPVPPQTIDLDRYCGRWYEFARDGGWSARRDENVVVDYARQPDGMIRILRGSVPARGDRSPRRRYARVVAGSENARFQLALFGPFFFGNHFVLDLGEAYDWSIVGEGSGRALRILTRVPVPAPDVEALLLARAQALGYDAGRLRRTRQTPA